MKNLKIVLTILSAASVGACFSDAFADPPAEMASLQRLTGRWRGSGVIIDNGVQTPVVVSWACKTELDGYAVSCRLNTDAYRAMHLLSFDVFEGSYSWSIACTDALVLKFTGQLLGDTLLFRDGERAYASLRFVDNETIDLAVSVRLGELGEAQTSYRMTRGD